MIKTLSLFLLIIFSGSAFADFSVESLRINCGENKGVCLFYKNRMETLKSVYKVRGQLIKALKSFSHLEGIKNFEFKLFHVKDSFYHLDVQFDLRILVSDIEFQGADNLALSSSDLSFVEGDFVDKDILNSSKFVIIKKLVERGYPRAQVGFKLKREKDASYTLVYEIKKNKPFILKKINIDINNKRNLFKIRSSLDELQGLPYDRNKLSIKLESLKSDFVNDGYLKAEYRIEEKFKGSQVEVHINFDVDTLYVFEFNKVGIKEKHELKKEARTYFLANKAMPSDRDWVSFFGKVFQKYGYQDVKVKIKKQNATNSFFETIAITRFEILLGEKYKLLTPVFIGNNSLAKDKMLELFYDSSTDLIRSDQFDLDYIKAFSKKLTKYYYTKGYVNAQVLKPLITIDNKSKEVFVSYRINEGDQALIDSIRFKSIDRDLAEKIKQKMTLKLKQPFNPFEFGSDLVRITDYLKSQGYYFARVANLKSKNIVEYLNDQTTVKINIDLDLGDLVRFDRYYVIGNNKTKEIIFRRQLFLEKGDVITPGKVVGIQNRLLATGLFESVRIDPIKISPQLSEYDLIIRVDEKKYGSIELAPGFRTDLGLKLSATITRNNLSGLNKSVSLSTQVNRRIDGLALHPQRRKGTKPIEYNLRLSFTENDIFKSTYVDYEASVSFIKRRYYSFDANIDSISQKLSRRFGEHVTVSLGYQLEQIRQYKSISSIDDGRFQIGTLTPSIQFDFRNSTINPRRGALFDLSVELSNPFFLSQKTDELEINYYKAISRNAFYYPLSSKWTLANSVTFGLQENLAKNGAGYIPNIKVFRLAGIDTVRGFEDEEINVVNSAGNDISELTINNKAYLVNYKFEPRYQVSDNFIAGAFFDAGRVFVNKLEPSELRQSVGLTFKYVTPVGTLDFDYGIKILRKTPSGGSKESPGRFHLSIGFF